MFPMQKRQLSFSSLFKKLVHNAVRLFSYFQYFLLSIHINNATSPFLYTRLKNRTFYVTGYGDRPSVNFFISG